MLLIICDS